jgi:hypothetical protein
MPQKQKRKHKKTTQILDANGMEVLRYIVGKKKIYRIKSQNLSAVSIQLLNEWKGEEKNETTCNKTGC